MICRCFVILSQVSLFLFLSPHTLSPLLFTGSIMFDQVVILSFRLLITTCNCKIIECKEHVQFSYSNHHDSSILSYACCYLQRWPTVLDTLIHYPSTIRAFNGVMLSKHSIHPSHILYCSFGLFVFSCKHTTSRSLFGHWSMLLVSLSLVGGRYISLAFFFDCFVLLVKVIRLISQLKQTNYVIHETIYDPNTTRFNIYYISL